MKLLCPALLVLLSALNVFSQTQTIEPGVPQELAKWRAALYSDVRYKLNLTLEKMSPVLRGTIEIRLKVAGQILSSAPGAAAVAPPIILDWRKLPGHEKDSTVTNITLNEIPLFNGDQRPEGLAPSPAFKYHESNDHLILPDAVKVGENVIKLDFTSPIFTSGSAITRYVDKEDGSEYIYSLFVPSDASTAFPVFDQPDLKARFNLSISRPHDWLVVSNTAGAAKTEFGAFREGQNPTFTYFSSFPETKPISTYVFAFAAGPFEGMSDGNAAVPAAVPGASRSRPEAGRLQDTQRDAGVTSTIYVRKSQAAKFIPHADEAFRLNREAVKYFEQYFDYKFPFPKYDLVLIPEFPFGGMEHAGATFLRESSIIFPQEPTKNDLVNRATLIFHETAHQWFGDTVTMRWFDDLWLKEGFATFMGYKALEKIMPEMNAWKVFYERIKQGAYQTDSTKGTTPIYQEIKNLSAAKSAYGNIVYNKAPAFLRQAEFYLGEDKFQTAVRAFLKKHEYSNAGWEDLVKEFEAVGQKVYLKDFANRWIRQRGLPIIRINYLGNASEYTDKGHFSRSLFSAKHRSAPEDKISWLMDTKTLVRQGERHSVETIELGIASSYNPPNYTANSENEEIINAKRFIRDASEVDFIFSNYQDYGYGIFLLDDKSRDYVLKNIQNEKDPFLRSMMWGALWDSVREGELDPKEYMELAIKNVPTEQDETIVSSILGRVGTATNYYVSEKTRDEVAPKLEELLLERIKNASTLGQRITFYRAFLNIAASENARSVLKNMLGSAAVPAAGRLQDSQRDAGVTKIPLKTKDKFDIVTRLLILSDPDAPRLLAELEKTETSDDAKRYAYAAKAGIPTADNKAKYWNDFTNNKEISESWIEAAFSPWNSIRHSKLTLPYLQKALQELPNHKRNRKIFFVNGWLGAFIGGQRSEEALAIVNKFLADNANLDKDLRLKILENVDLIERAVRIRAKYGRN